MLWDCETPRVIEREVFFISEKKRSYFLRPKYNNFRPLEFVPKYNNLYTNILFSTNHIWPSTIQSFYLPALLIQSQPSLFNST